MYRVELKVCPSGLPCRRLGVPNVPCGVESIWLGTSLEFLQVFLMYRVELKGLQDAKAFKEGYMFLMYRVELKDHLQSVCNCKQFAFLMYRVELKA